MRHGLEVVTPATRRLTAARLVGRSSWVADELVSLSLAWKLVLAVALLAAIFVSAAARGRRDSRCPGSELRRLVALRPGALCRSGWLASLTHHALLGGARLLRRHRHLRAGRLALARDAIPRIRPGSEEPDDERPPPEPDGVPRFDWARFEREFRAYSRRAASRRGSR